MKTTSYTVKSVSAAWAKVNDIFPGDYNEDTASSERAGYNIFRSPIEHYNYICDLGNRLEVNLASGETVNIWIEEEAAETENENQNENGATAENQDETDNPEIISDYEILKAAYTEVLRRWANETERKEKLNEEGKPSPIADFRIDKTQKQLDELHKRILRIEHGNK